MQNTDKNILELRDILQVMDLCFDLKNYVWKLIYYEFNELNPGLKIKNEIIDYLRKDSVDGMNIQYQDLHLFSKTIYQTIDCKIHGSRENTNILITAIDSTDWEIQVNSEQIYLCLLDKFGG